MVVAVAVAAKEHIPLARYFSSFHFPPLLRPARLFSRDYYRTNVLCAWPQSCIANKNLTFDVTMR